MSWLDPFGFLNKSTTVRSNVPDVPGYPAELVRPIVLRDGARLRMRPVSPDDVAALEALFHRLSPRTVYHRFFAPYERLRAEWYRHFANVDYRARLALVAEDERAGALRAVARYEPGEAPGIAEVAVVVEDPWQGRGLGTLLLDALLQAAEPRGLRRFTADVLADNRRMLHVLWRVGEIRRRTVEEGVVSLEFERRRAFEGSLFA